MSKSVSQAFKELENALDAYIDEARDRIAAAVVQGNPIRDLRDMLNDIEFVDELVEDIAKFHSDWIPREFEDPTPVTKPVKAKAAVVAAVTTGAKALPLSQFFVPILASLDVRGCRLQPWQVLDDVFWMLRDRLTDKDYERDRPDSNTTRWRMQVYRARYAMVKKGLLHSNSSTGSWVLANHGRNYLLGALNGADGKMIAAFMDRVKG